jgi:hypothetical protein
MMIRLRALPALAAAVLLGVAATASAALPAPVKPGHPRLYTDQAGFDLLAAKFPRLDGVSTQADATLGFKLLARNLEAGDADKGVNALFGLVSSERNGIYIRHIAGDAGKVRLQIVLKKATGTADGENISVRNFDIDADAVSSIELSWSSVKHTVGLTVNGTQIPMGWLAKDGKPLEWTADQQTWQFNPRKGEAVSDVSLKNTAGGRSAFAGVVDIELVNAWAEFITQVDKDIDALGKCPAVVTAATEPKICNVGDGAHRLTMLTVAQQFALAYKLTHNRKYFTAALDYLDKMLAVDLDAGSEWSMGGRIGAMALIYDWLNKELQPPFTDARGRNYLDVLATTIKSMIVFSRKYHDDLATSMCGYNNPIDLNATVFDCKVKPVFEKWDRVKAPWAPNTATTYLGGHPFSAMSTMTLALLAIAEEHPEVTGMLDTAYSHYEKGYLAAREFVSLDGGHHMGWAYPSTNSVPERLLMWRSALQDNGGGPVFPADWSAKLIHPYIYAMRGDGNYPASGDNFGSTQGSTFIGFMALWAGANTGDSAALKFYRDQLLPWRSGAAKGALILERLYWPAPATDASLDQLDLSRRFRNAGQVVMRDTWDFPQATLMEFKSSSFTSVNHQHLDQNSFSLYYKAPLLLDSGFYDEYATSHWWNYYTRTIAHNSIVVFDENAAQVTRDGSFSNDGGQWYPNVDILYPTIEEAMPGGVNALAGVEAYEYAANDQGAFTYTRGNASKAYPSAALDQQQGFVREMVFLRSPSFAAKPVAVIFDRVLSKRDLPATFVLHSAARPALSGAAGSASGGRYTTTFASGGERIATMRNGGGMVTVQTLLPIGARIDMAGGFNEGQICEQRLSVPTATGAPTMTSPAPNGDCRFLVRERLAADVNGKPAYAWRNFPLRKDDQKPWELADTGKWRLEVSDPTPPSNNAAQYFLHVLSVADNDKGTQVARGAAAIRLTGSPGTEAVLLGGSTIVAFNRNAAPAGRLGWTGAATAAEIIASGLKPNTPYALTVAASGADSSFALTEVSAGPLTSSSEGVLRIPSR